MNPTFLDDMSWEMAEVYGAVSDQILINLAHYFPWYDESKLPRSTFAYQADMLAQMGKVSRDAVNIIHRNLDGADEALRGILEQAIIDSIRATNPPLLDAAKQGILKPAGVPIVAPNQMRAYSLYYKQAADKLNLVNTVMLESTQQAYAATVADVVARVQATQTALDIGAGEAITGVSSWNQATQHAIRRMADRGITGFIDHGGHRWSAEAYVAMDIRTTVANTARSAVWETNENFGNDLYSVSYHNGARPLCYPWQNKVISATDQARTVADLDGNEITVYAQSDTTYGQAAGLFGINCKHYPTPFIPGVSLIRGEPQDKEANDLAYDQSQEQRRLERKLREDRRDLMMMKARGVPEEQIRAQQAKCDQSSQDIEDFCDSTGRARRRNREGVYTKRSFPAADTYDVTAFERTQQEQLREYFANGGAQQGYTFGTPAQDTTPAAQIAQAAPPVEAQEAENSLDSLFGDLWSGDVDESEFLRTTIEEPQFHASRKYGSFGIENADYPKELRLTSKEETYIENFIKDARGEKTPKEFEYSRMVGTALRPVKTLELSDLKRAEIRIEADAARAKLAKAEEMIAQRKAEGYKGKTRQESYQDWQRLKRALNEAADEIEHAEILGSASIGEDGIQYWYTQRKQANTRLSFVDFANKIVNREQFALEHGFDGTDYD